MPARIHRTADGHVERVELAGHIIDSLLLPKVLDHITAGGGAFRIEQITIGQARNDPSYALIEVHAPSAERLQQILADIADHGAVADRQPGRPPGRRPTSPARFPRASTARPTSGPRSASAASGSKCRTRRWTAASLVDPAAGTARCLAMTDVASRRAVRRRPRRRPRASRSSGETQAHGFEFMNSAVSTEKPKGVAIRQIAHELIRTRREGGKALLVGGPAIVHTGSVEHLSRLIRKGYIHRLFAGNALATHDIEQALFGTSLGVRLDSGDIIEAGHEHHLRAINRIRRLGGIRQAVEAGELKSGIMYECVKNNVEFLLAGSIRDDGPLPEVITDMLVAQARMREQIRDVTFCLMVATTLHSIAVGNLLPAWVKVVCVDINPSTVIKLADRGSFQTVGLVTDVEPFFRRW